MTPTELFILRLGDLKAGDLGLLRTHAGQRLDQSLNGFDLFTGLWWPLRQENARAPRREVAWLIAKLYASCPMPHAPGATLARLLGRLQPNGLRDKERSAERFDRMLVSDLCQIEPFLQSALRRVVSGEGKLDWARLTDDLSIWEREATRLRWAEEFLGAEERR